ncbi:MAG: glycosyltransferase [Sulfuricurvum sp.]|nr:glycosyltransferase [Sulfuricurvum sp.]
MSPKVSVIIPVYNVEAYLEECLDSILSQDLSELEIICVNDGSTDNSLVILQRYAVQDERIILIEQENSGAASARNSGLKKARGEYIFIPDSDDYLLTTTALSLLHTTASEHDLDIVSFDFSMIGDEEKAYHTKRKSGIVSNGKDFLRNGDNIVMPWCKFYKRTYLDSIHFVYNETIAYEDDEALPRLYVNASRVSHIDTILYAYRQRQNSVMTQKISLKHFESLVTIITTYDSLLRKESHNRFRKYLKRRIYDYLFRFYYLSLNNNGFSETATIYNKIKDNLFLSKLDLFFVNNDEKFIQYAHVNSKNKFAHPVIYLLRKLRKILF